MMTEGWKPNPEPERDPTVFEGRVISDKNPFRESLIRINRYPMNKKHYNKIVPEILILADQLEECGCPYFADRIRYALDKKNTLSLRLYIRKMFGLLRFYMSHHQRQVKIEDCTIENGLYYANPNEYNLSQGWVHHFEWNNYLNLLRDSGISTLNPFDIPTYEGDNDVH